MVKTETKQSDAEQLVRSKLDELIEFRSQTDDIKEFWGKQFDLGLIKYHTPDQMNVFCDAYCSNAWYDKTFEKLDASKDQTRNNGST